MIGPAGDKDGDSLGEAEGAAEHPGERRGGDGKVCAGESFVRAVGVRSWTLDGEGEEGGRGWTLDSDHRGLYILLVRLELGFVLLSRWV